MIIGIGAALTEELHHEDGQLLNADAFQYRLPLMGDIPEAFASGMIENEDGPGPFGSKGIANFGPPVTPPAIGVRIMSNPVHAGEGVPRARNGRGLRRPHAGTRRAQ
ncbi:MAG: molybdopterin-dependent oxidoreductase [Chloroflexi bacterium]|nr:molybdopterin-dependent oxidoreductase [Chloroflexota bacterium]